MSELMRDDSRVFMISDTPKNLEGHVGHPDIRKTSEVIDHKLSLQTTAKFNDCTCCRHKLSEESKYTMMIDTSRPVLKKLNVGNYSAMSNQAAGMSRIAQVFHSDLQVNDTKRELLQQLFEDHVKDRYTQINKSTDKVSVYPNLDNPPTRTTYQSIDEYESLYEELCKIDVIIDTGATSHCFPLKHIFNTYTILPAGDRTISYADGSTSDVVGVGDTCLLTKVLHVPNMKLGIISVSMLDKAGYHSLFSNNKVIVMDKDSTEVLLSGTLMNGLYQLHDLYIRALADNQCNYPMDANDGPVNSKASIHVKSGVKRMKRQREARERSDEYMRRFADDESVESDNNNNDNNESDKSVTLGSEDTWSEDGSISTETVNVFKGSNNITQEKNVKGKLRLENSPDNLLMQLHKRYGHLGELNLKLAYKNKIINDSKYTYNDIKDMSLGVCPDCMRGRMKAFTSGPTTQHPWEIFQKVAMDYKGPFKQKSKEGYSGFYLFSDYKSDYVWAYPVRSKSEGGEALQQFYDTFIKNRSPQLKEVIMEVVQSDVDSVIKSKISGKVLSKLNLRLQLSPAYKHSQNGQIERDMQSVLDKARTMLASYDVPIQWWWRAVSHAIYCINRSPTSKGNKRSPVEQVYNITPNIDNMIPFFAPGLYHVTKEERSLVANTVWAHKARACRFLGYDEITKGYLLYDIHSSKIVGNRSDVIWDPTLIEKWYRSSHDLLGTEVINPDSYPEHDLDEISSEGDDMLKSVPSEELKDVLADDSSDSSEYSDVHYWNNSSINYTTNNFYNYYTIASDYEDRSSYQLMRNFSFVDTLENFEVEINPKKSLLERVNHTLKQEVKGGTLQFRNEVEEDIDQFILTVIHSVHNVDLIDKLPPAPKTEREALSEDNPDRPRWIEAIAKELEILQLYNVFDDKLINYIGIEINDETGVTAEAVILEVK